MKLEIKIIKDITEAAKLWRLLVIEKTIYDNWEFRACFHKYHQKELLFYAGYLNDDLIGLLPLQYNDQEKHLEFFGGSYMEDNCLMLKPGYEQYIPEFFAAIQQPAKLISIVGNDPFTTSLPLFDYKYILPLKNITTVEDYYTHYLDGEARGKMRRKIRKIEGQITQIDKNNFEDLDLLIKHNIENFGEQSGFVDRPYLKEIYYELLKLPYEKFLFTFTINGEKMATSFAILYKGVYEYFNFGVHNNSPRDLTTYVTIENLKSAITSKATLFDAFIGDYGWKKHWRFDKTPQYIFEKDI